MKNPTPYQLAIYSSLFIASTTVLALAVLIMAGYLDVAFICLIVVFAFVFSVAFIAIKRVLEQYIYRKIKLIYKSIHRLKMKSESNGNQVDLATDIIEEVGKDVTEWANDRSQEIERLVSLESYRRDFLGNISHELKTPIFNIQGYLETLLEGGIDDKEINVPYLKKASKNVDRLHHIVQDLESIARMESGKLQMDLQSFDIKDLSQEVIDEMEFKADQKGISLHFKEGASKPYRVLADRENIRIVLVNLVSNSIKYGKQGGRTQIGFYDMDSFILIEVADNGVGIPEEEVPRVFERFYRVDKSRSRAQGGTGLGLAIVKHIIEAHKQTINVRSSTNVGSTFGFTLKRE